MSRDVQKDIEGKKGTSFAISINSTSDALKDLVASMGYDLLTMLPADKGVVAEKLSRIAGQDPPWTWRYVHNVMGNKIEASTRFADSILKMLAVFDGANPLMVEARRVQVYAIRPVAPGSIVLTASRRCANPACPIEFVPVVPRQRYCSSLCRQGANARKSTRPRGL